MADIYLRRTLTGFEFADEESRELGRGYRIGDVLKATIVKPRDMTSLKHFQALIQVTYENLPVRYHQMWPTRRKFRRMLADAVGHVEEFVTQEGERRTDPLSVSFDDIKDEAEFTRIFGLMMAVCAHLLSIENVDDLAAEVDRYAIGHYGARAA